MFSYDENKLSNVYEWNNNGVNQRAEELKSLDSNIVDKWLRPMTAMKMLF